MTDADERCDTLGCENEPAAGRHCQECADISPGILGDGNGVDKISEAAETARENSVEGDSGGAAPTPDVGETAFDDAVEWFHGQLNREISDHAGEGEHPERPTTARDYFREERGWSDATIDDALLGYAPASETGLLDHLMREGYDRETILGTGLFTEDLRPLWQGRYVLPYFDADGRPVYAISRATGIEGGGAVGYDGHPNDGMSGKYAKPAHTKEYADIEEPIFGLGSVEDGQPVLITEGIADAITAHQAGYSCLSPVTTRFKHDDRERLVEVLNDLDIPQVYVVGDAERPGSDLDDEGRLTVSQAGEGLRGALDTAAHLARDGVDARVAELPRPGLDKVDLDDYLRGWATDGDLSPVLASAKPASEHPAYDPKDTALEAARGRDRTDAIDSDGDHSALFDLDLRDVADVGEGYRGVNPLGHHGESENYTVVVGSGRDGVLYDHKHKAAYNALTYLLVEAGERRPDSPHGSLDDGEVLAAWVHAKREGYIADDDPIPHRGLRHVALDGGLCERGDIEDGWKLPAGAYNDALEAVHAEYDLDSGRRPVSGSAETTEPVSALPLAQLDALSPSERRRTAKKRGVEWPDTDDARERLFQTVTEVMRHEDSRVVDAPTSLGKSHTIAATPWDAPQYDGVTGERPIVHLSKTRDARDEAVNTAVEHGGGCFTLRGRHEACPVAAGDYDPEACEGEERQPITVDGTPASGWLDAQCERKGIPFSVAHTRLKSQMDQDRELPCCADGERCRAIVQWEDLRDGDHALIEATHNFARVPGLRNRTNLVFDEEPDFAEDLSTDRVRRMITALLKELDAPVSTWEAFIGLVRMDGYGGDAGREADELGHALDNANPDRDWYFDAPDAHTLAPAIARAIYYGEDRGNGRWGATTSHEPPRLDAEAGDDDGWNREWVRVVLDEDNEVRSVRTSPDLSLCRSVIGLDAHPAMPIWQVNTKPDIGQKEVLDATERQLWRRYERGLRVVQVGDATRPHASGEYFNGDGTAAMLEHLRGEHGSEFRTAITASSVEGRTQELMREAGISNPETMHYGEEKSRNDFAGESIGFVNGSIDPGDDFVINLLAELDLDAEPETATDDDGEEYRAHGRGFAGEDAETAAEILASVRENHVAQAAGRYARDPDDPEATATVFVRTDAMPTEFADVQVPGVEWVYSDQQRAVVEALRERERPASAKDIAGEAGVSKGHTQRTLRRLAENSAVQRFEGEGSWGADLYAESGVPTSGTASTDGEFSKPVAYGEPNTWAVSISPPTPTPSARGAASTPDSSERHTWWVDDGPPPTTEADD